jgi:hypothetical protein
MHLFCRLQCWVTGLLQIVSVCLVLTSSAQSPPNDYFTNRISLSGSVVVTQSNLGATNEIGEPLHAGQIGGRSLWWSWTASRNTSVTISTLGSDFDTLLGVYTGQTLASLVEVASNDDASFTEVTSRVTFNAAAGTTSSRTTTSRIG